MIKILLSICVAGALLQAKVSNQERQLIKSVIPGSKIVDIDKTPMDGLYIVLLENKKFLFVYPYKKIIFFGELMTSSGQSLSSYLKSNLLKANVSNEDVIKKMLSKKESITEMYNVALKTKYNKGNDKYAFYVFTDPDCPFCKKLESFFATSNIDARYIFNPLVDMHPKALAKSQHMTSNPNNVQKVLEMIGNDVELEMKINEDGKIRLEKMRKIAKELELLSTPMLLIFDKTKKEIVDFVKGADIEKLKTYIKEKTDEK